MNRLATDKQVQVLACLVEGNSIRATCRMTGAAKGTVTRLLCQVGAACKKYQERNLYNLDCKVVQCDEIWAFCYGKKKNLPKEYQGKYGYGSVWTWVALDADSKLVICWHVGRRELEDAHRFLTNLEPRLKNRVQLTTDGNRSYSEVMSSVFTGKIDYAQVQKIYGGRYYQTEEGERRYSPSECLGSEKVTFIGSPDDALISTSFVERSNLTMRMGMRRFTRLTNAFSKKVQNLEYAVALHFMYYNFCRPHQALNPKRALGITPAMAAGVADHQWDIEEIVALISN